MNQSLHEFSAMKVSHRNTQIAFPFMPEETEEKSQSITFRPDDDNWEYLQAAIIALGPEGKVRGVQTRLVNDALRVGLPLALKAWSRVRRKDDLQDFFVPTTSTKRKNGKGR